MIIKRVEFIKSSPNLKECPRSLYPEFAFVGRSNVGKSSLVNALTSRKSLAKTSSKPGKTQLINHFLVNQNWYLVDLPGYGWAKVSRTLRQNFSKLLEEYLLKRKTLVCVFVLIDSRLMINQRDTDFLDFLVRKGLPICLIFTKIDKLSEKQLQTNFRDFETEKLKIWEYLPPYFFSSASQNKGLDLILDYIETVKKQV